MTTVAIVECRTADQRPGVWSRICFARDVEVAKKRMRGWFYLMRWRQSGNMWYSRRLKCPEGVIQTFRISVAEVEE